MTGEGGEVVWGWIIPCVLAMLLVLLCLMRVGIYARYDGALLLRLKIGPYAMTLVPKPEKKAEKKSAPESGAAKPNAERKKTFSAPNKAQILYSIEVLPGVLKKALYRFGRGIVVDPFRLSVVFAGEDPADTAQNYGKAQALVSALYPNIKRMIRMKNTRIDLSTDYQREKMEISGEVGAALRIGTVLMIGITAGIGLFGWLKGYRKLAAPTAKQAVPAAEEKNGRAEAA